MACRVVCGLLLVIATLLPTSALVSVDLPALGRPTRLANPQRCAVGVAVIRPAPDLTRSRPPTTKRGLPMAASTSEPPQAPAPPVTTAAASNDRAPLASAEATARCSAGSRSGPRTTVAAT